MLPDRTNVQYDVPHVRPQDALVSPAEGALDELNEPRAIGHSILRRGKLERLQWRTLGRLRVRPHRDVPGNKVHRGIGRRGNGGAIMHIDEISHALREVGIRATVGDLGAAPGSVYVEEHEESI